MSKYIGIADYERWEARMRENYLIVGVSKDRKGLLIRTKSMAKNSYWHAHSDELSPYQKRELKRLLANVE